MDYNDIAKHYDNGYEGYFFSREDEAVAEVVKYRAGKILDIGCGTGLGISITKAAPENYTGIDVSEKILEVARKKNPEYRFLNKRVTEMRNESRYDLAIALYGVMNYLTDEEVEEAMRKAESFFFMDYIDGYHPVCYPNNEFPERKFNPENFRRYFAGKFNNYNIYSDYELGRIYREVQMDSSKVSR